MLSDIFMVGPDEGYELYKAFELTGSSAVTPWNDQPWGYSLLLSVVFRCFGPNAGAARMVAIFLFFLMLLGSRMFVLRTWAGVFLFGLFILVQDGMLALSTSAMVEAPTFELAFFATCLGVYTLRRQNTAGSFIAGACAAASLHFKLTAVLVLFPAACYIAFLNWRESERNGCGIVASFNNHRNALLSLLLGFVTAGAVGIFCSPYFDPSTMIETHLHSQNMLSEGEQGSAFNPFALPKNTLILLFIGVIGLVLSWGKLPSAKWFLILTLAGVLIAHAIQRPWWSYYVVHWAIPVAALGVLVIEHAFIANIESRSAMGTLACVGAISAITFAIVPTLIFESQSLMYRERVRYNPIIQVLAHTYRGELIYSRDPLYAFYVGAVLPPELSLLPAKRFWTGAMSDAHLVATLERMNPKAIVADKQNDLSIVAFVHLLQQKYEFVRDDTHSALYIRKQNDLTNDALSSK